MRLKISRLQNKLFLLLLVITMVCFIVNTVIVFLYNQRMVEQETQNAVQSHNQTVKDIQNFLEQFAGICDNLSYNELLMGVLNPEIEYDNAYEIYDLYQNKLNILLNDMFTEELGVDMRVYFYNKTFFQDYRVFFRLNQDILPNAACQAAAMDKKKLALSCEGKTISFSKFIRDNNSSDIGICTLSFKEEKLYSFFKDLRPQNRMIAIVDSNGIVVSSNERSLLGNTLSDKPLLESGMADYETNGNRGRAIVTPLVLRGMPMGWKIITLVPFKELFAQSNQMFSISIGICLSFLVFMTIFESRMLQNPMGRIAHLISGMNEVRKENFQQIENVYPDDEIGQMIESFNRMSSTINKLINENYRYNLKMQDLEIRNREAELNMLHRQLSPHFLFNTLESIRMKLVRNNSSDAQQMIKDLSKLLRVSLYETRKEISLAEDLMFVESYISIQQRRFYERLNVSVDIPNELQNCIVPKFILQPLVENAIIHGLEPKKEGGTVIIKAYKENDGLLLCIKDDGIGIEPERLSMLQYKLQGCVEGYLYSGIGIYNIHDRILLEYGNPYGVSLESQEGLGTKVSIYLPLRF